MKLKQSISYQLYMMGRPVAIFYGIQVLSYIAFILLRLAFGSRDITMNGSMTATPFFLLILGMNMFKAPLKMYVQNGLSRKSLLAGFAIVATLMSFVMMVVDLLQPVIVPKLFNVTFYEILYGRAAQEANILHVVMWTAMLYLSATMMGFMISTLYYRMNKLLKVLVSVGVPALLFIVLPIWEAVRPSANVFSTLVNFIIWCLGIEAIGFGNLQVVSIVRPILCFAAAGVLYAGISYLLMRRATLKEA